MQANQITEMLHLFVRHKIGLNLPMCSRTLLKTPSNIEITQVAGVNYFYLIFIKYRK